MTEMEDRWINRHIDAWVEAGGAADKNKAGQVK